MPNTFAAILFADVSGSSRLFKQLGDSSARAIIARIVAMMIEKTNAHQGRLIKTIGDECMSYFDAAEQAAKAAIAMQKTLSETDYGAALSIRIGFHYGAVIKEANDVYGEAVNDAAYLVNVAKGSQIITSQATVNALPATLKSACEVFDKVRIKGAQSSEVVYILSWQTQQDSNATQFVALNADQQLIADEAQLLTLNYEGQRIAIYQHNVPFSIGRDASCDLTVRFNATSREHCKIDYRRGKFVLVDNSTNGSYVQIEQGAVIYLRREEAPLSGEGLVSFSSNIEQAGAHRLRFTCQ